jgi:hypothetical protein
VRARTARQSICSRRARAAASGPGEVERVLVHRAQLRDHDVVQRHDRQRLRLDAQLVGALQELVDPGQPGEVPDEVDQHVAVPGLEEPALRRALGPHAGADQRLQPALAVLLAHREVDVVVGRRAAAGPAGHAPGQGERHVGVTQGGGRALERLDDLGGLRRRLIRAHGGHLPRPAPVHHAAHRVMGGG